MALSALRVNSPAPSRIYLSEIVSSAAVLETVCAVCSSAGVWATVCSCAAAWAAGSGTGSLLSAGDNPMKSAAAIINTVKTTAIPVF